MVLNKEELRKEIEENGLIQNYPHLETQLTPQGFDLTAGEIHEYMGSGKLDFSNSEREIPDSEPIEPVKKSESDEYGWWKLEQGAYKVVMNEKVDIPEDLVAFAFPRSSLLRMGCSVENAVWDSGYTGTGSFMLVVENPEGVEIKQNARINQLVFHRIEETERYSGRYHEGEV
ncbi:MAG: deoxyuridine 5'-triphosphate nucleotidohydrolase [Candidatus Nanohaloarchaea archaeon]